MTLSVLALYDDLRRCITDVMTDGTSEEESLRVLHMLDLYHEKCLSYASETARIQKELDESLTKMGDLEGKLHNARCIVDREKKLRCRAEYERDIMESKIMDVADLLPHERNLNNETRNKLAFIHTLPSSRNRKSLNTLREDESCGDFNSTSSLLSDLSISLDEDEHRPSLPKNQVPCVSTGLNNSAIGTPTATTASTRRLDVAQGAERFCATTKVYIPHDGNGVIRAESTIESLPIQDQLIGLTSTPRRSANLEKATAPPLKPMNAAAHLLAAETGSPAQHRPLMRKHNFKQKTFLLGEKCVQCQKQ